MVHIFKIVLLTTICHWIRTVSFPLNMGLPGFWMLYKPIWK